MQTSKDWINRVLSAAPSNPLAGDQRQPAGWVGLPVAVVSGLIPDQVEVVITHQLAHIRRLDNLVNVVQQVIEDMLFFQTCKHLLEMETGTLS